jgi:hypothetical protein
MANQYENPDAEHVHITHINDTKAGLTAQLDNCQIAIETDFVYNGETVPVLSFRDHNGVYREVTVFDNLAHKIEDHIDFTEADCFPSPSFVVYDTELGMYKPWQAYREWQHTGSSLVTDFNADKLDGFHAASFALFDHLHDTRYSQIGHPHVASDITNFTAAVQAVGDLRYSYSTHNHDTRYALLSHSQAISTITGLQDALNLKWDANNDGAGSGLDADRLDTYHAANFLGKNGSAFYQADNYIQFSSIYGLLFPSSGSGTQFSPTSLAHGSFDILGSKGGWSGLSFNSCAYEPTI